MCCEPVLQLSSPPLDPSPAAVRRHISLDPVPASAGVAREFIRDTFAALDPDVQHIVLLLGSELVTNAILHARTPVRLGIVLDSDHALVCVADRMAGGALVSDGDRMGRPGGRGLSLVAELSDRWGSETYAGGKTVWFTLTVSVGSLRAG